MCGSALVPKRDVRQDIKSPKNTSPQQRVRKMNVPTLAGAPDTPLSEYTKLAAENGKLRAELVNLEKLDRSDWPNKIRNGVFNFEGEFNISKMVVCKQHGGVHTPFCCFVESTSKMPVEPKARRIFKRRQRWLHAMTSSSFSDNPRVQKIILNLKTKFDEIHGRNEILIE